MQPDVSDARRRKPDIGNVAVQDVTGLKEQSLLETVFANQAFWVTVALAIICLTMSYLQPDAFASTENFYNITRNFAFIGIMSVGMVAVIITGGIDLSVGTIMGFVGVVCGVILQAEYPWWIAIAGGLLGGALLGAVNGVLIAYVG